MTARTILRQLDFVRGNRVMRTSRWLGISLLLLLLLGACGGSDNSEGEFYTH
jgi:hypothetical protein